MVCVFEKNGKFVKVRDMEVELEDLKKVLEMMARGVAERYKAEVHYVENVAGPLREIRYDVVKNYEVIDRYIMMEMDRYVCIGVREEILMKYLTELLKEKTV